MSTKQDILNYFGRDFRGFFERYGVRFTDRKVQTVVRCPWHDDQHPSLSINTAEGTFCCHAGCGSGNIFDFYARQRGLSAHADFPKVVEGIAAEFGLGVHRDLVPSEAGPSAAPESLLKINPLSAELRAWLAAHKKIYSDATLQHFGIGESQYRGEPCLVIPIREDLQKLYFWQRLNKQKRWQHHPKGKGWLYDENDATDEVILCEGEWDFLTLYDRGYRGLATGTTGAGHLPKGLVERLKDKEVTIVYDRDKAGREGAKKAAQALQGYARSVLIAELPEAVGEGGDVSDYFNKLGGAPADFYEDVLRTAKPYEPSQADAERLRQDLLAGPPMEPLHPAQDFVDGCLYYAVYCHEDLQAKKSERRLYILNARREVFLIPERGPVRLPLLSRQTRRPRLSKAALEGLLAGTFSVSMAALFVDVRHYIDEYIFLDDPDSRTLLALWTLGTYVFKVFRYYPYLWLNSLVKGSGKTLLMEILEPIAFNGTMGVMPSPAVLYRAVHENAPTIFLDEVERLRSQDREQFGAIMMVLNSGFNRGGRVARTDRTASGSHRAVEYSTYCPKVLAGLSELDEVLRDRTIRLYLLKKSGRQRRLYRDNAPTRAQQQRLRDQLYGMGLQYAAILAARYDQPEAIQGMDHLVDREYDLWQPLFVLANQVDAEDPSAGATAQMTRLSQTADEQKRREYRVHNEVVQMLALWQQIRSEALVSAERFEPGYEYYSAEAVFRYFRSTDDFADLPTPKALTVRLERIQISCERRRVGKVRMRFYRVEPVVFERLCRQILTPLDGSGHRDSRSEQAASKEVT